MSVRNALKQAHFSYRDVPLCLNGPLVLALDGARAVVDDATKRLRFGEIALARALEPSEDAGGGDERMSQVSSTVDNLRSEVDAARSVVAEAQGELERVEARAREASVIIRFTALPKGQFQKRRQEYEKDGEALYSRLARETSSEVLNPDAPEDEKETADLDDEIWDDLEPALTAGQWQLIINAIDAINIVEARLNLGFLSSGSATTPN